MNTDTKWRWLADETYHWKGHVIDVDLAHDLEYELYERAKEDGHECVFTTKPQTDYVYVDMPGMVWMGRRHRKFEVDGLKFEVPSEDLYDILAQVRLLKERKFESGRAYYKLHLWRFCVVFTLEQRAAFIAEAEKQLPDAEREADEDHKSFLAAIDKVNEAGVKVVSARAEKIREANEGKKEGLN